MFCQPDYNTHCESSEKRGYVRFRTENNLFPLPSVDIVSCIPGTGTAARLRQIYAKIREMEPSDYTDGPRVSSTELALSTSIRAVVTEHWNNPTHSGIGYPSKNANTILDTSGTASTCALWNSTGSTISDHPEN